MSSALALSAAAFARPTPLLAQATAAATPIYDLVIKGGEVIDPSQNLRARRDVAIRYARLAALEPEIPSEQAEYVLPADGKLVVPGLVDMHVHVFPEASALGLPPDELVPLSATTTCVSAGDAGGNNFSGFKHWVIDQSRTRIFASRTSRT
jgi:dihydroorotase